MLKSIFQAAGDNDLESLNAILDSHPTMVNCADEATGRRPIHFAAKANALDAAEILLQAGADCNALDTSGASPLQLSGGERILRVLRRHGAHFSDSYQLLKEAQRAKRLVRLTYHEHTRVVRVIQLGLTDGKERCFAWQNDSPGRMWNLARAAFESTK